MSATQTIPRHGQLGPTACILVETLKRGKPGDTLTADQLSKECGHKVSPGEKAYASLTSAVRYCIREFSLHWVWVRGEDRIQCLTSAETVENTASGLRSIRRRAKREIEKASTAKLAELDDTSRQKLLTASAVFGGISLFTDKKFVQKLESNSASNTPNLQKSIELFK